MKRLEDIKKEYETYSLRNVMLKKMDEYITWTELKKDDLSEDIKDAKKAILYNRVQGKRMKLISYLLPQFDDEVEYYKMDSDVLQEAIGIACKWTEYYTTLQECVDEEQLPEWARLLDFTSDYYDANADFLESKRHDLDLAFRGIESFNPKFQDSREAFDQFFQESIEILCPKKAVQKTKDM